MNEFTKNIVRLLGVAVTAVRCAKRGARQPFIEPTYVERNLRAARDVLREAAELLEADTKKVVLCRLPRPAGTYGTHPPDSLCPCNAFTRTGKARLPAAALTRAKPAPS